MRWVYTDEEKDVVVEEFRLKAVEKGAEKAADKKAAKAADKATMLENGEITDEELEEAGGDNVKNLDV